MVFDVKLRRLSFFFFLRYFKIIRKNWEFEYKGNCMEELEVSKWNSNFSVERFLRYKEKYFLNIFYSGSWFFFKILEVEDLI